jgi:hypothetical protein
MELVAGLQLALLQQFIGEDHGYRIANIGQLELVHARVPFSDTRWRLTTQ